MSRTDTRSKSGASGRRRRWKPAPLRGAIAYAGVAVVYGVLATLLVISDAWFLLLALPFVAGLVTASWWSLLLPLVPLIPVAIWEEATCEPERGVFLPCIDSYATFALGLYGVPLAALGVILRRVFHETRRERAAKGLP